MQKGVLKSTANIHSGHHVKVEKLSKSRTLCYSSHSHHGHMCSVLLKSKSKVAYYQISHARLPNCSRTWKHTRLLVKERSDYNQSAGAPCVVFRTIMMEEEQQLAQAYSAFNPVGEPHCNVCLAPIRGTGASISYQQGHLVITGQ